MIVGEPVTVYRDTESGTDRFGEPVGSTTTETVEDVLVAPGGLVDVSDPSRPDGVRVVWTLHFPKTYTGSLRGARVSVRGGVPLHVGGDPQHYTAENTPGYWSMPVELWRVDG